MKLFKILSSLTLTLLALSLKTTKTTTDALQQYADYNDNPNPIKDWQSFGFLAPALTSMHIVVRKVGGKVYFNHTAQTLRGPLEYATITNWKPENLSSSYSEPYFGGGDDGDIYAPADSSSLNLDEFAAQSLDNLRGGLSVEPQSSGGVFTQTLHTSTRFSLGQGDNVAKFSGQQSQDIAGALISDTTQFAPNKTLMLALSNDKCQYWPFTGFEIIQILDAKKNEQFGVGIYENLLCVYKFEGRDARELATLKKVAESRASRVKSSKRTRPVMALAALPDLKNKTARNRVLVLGDAAYKIVYEQIQLPTGSTGGGDTIRGQFDERELKSRYNMVTTSPHTMSLDLGKLRVADYSFNNATGKSNFSLSDAKGRIKFDNVVDSLTSKHQVEQVIDALHVDYNLAFVTAVAELNNELCFVRDRTQPAMRCIVKGQKTLKSDGVGSGGVPRQSFTHNLPLRLKDGSHLLYAMSAYKLDDAYYYDLVYAADSHKSATSDTTDNNNQIFYSHCVNAECTEHAIALPPSDITVLNATYCQNKVVAFYDAVYEFVDLGHSFIGSTQSPTRSSLRMHDKGAKNIFFQYYAVHAKADKVYFFTYSNSMIAMAVQGDCEHLTFDSPEHYLQSEAILMFDDPARVASGLGRYDGRTAFARRANANYVDPPFSQPATLYALAELDVFGGPVAEPIVYETSRSTISLAFVIIVIVILILGAVVYYAVRASKKSSLSEYPMPARMREKNAAKANLAPLHSVESVRSKLSAEGSKLPASQKQQAAVQETPRSPLTAAKSAALKRMSSRKSVKSFKSSSPIRANKSAKSPMSARKSAKSAKSFSSPRPPTPTSSPKLKAKS